METNLARQILFEDNHLIIVNKKPSQIVQGDKTGDAPLSELLKQWIKVRDQKPGNVFLGVAHRLDRPVSGVVLFAKTSKALARVNEAIRQRKIEKTYWAIVRNAPPKEKDTLVHYLRKNESQNKSYVCQKGDREGLEARLSYQLIAKSDRYYLLEVQLHTGRHHQIRAQLAAMGCPIQGDLKYGDSRSNPDQSIGLHARCLKLEHPVRKEMLEITAPVPDTPLWNFFEEKVVSNCSGPSPEEVKK